MRPDQWWSWTADLPAEVRHLPSGFVVQPLLYAASKNESSRLPPGENVVFGRRPIGDREIALTLSLAGTRLAWRYGIGGSPGLAIDWRTEAFGEWGLRFWVMLCLYAEGEAWFRFDDESGVLSGVCGEHRLTVTAGKAPLFASFHDDLESLERELEEHGYFYLGSRGIEGRFAVLRFNLEEAPEMHLDLALTSPQVPEARSPRSSAPPAAESAIPSEPQQALEAIHDVMAWNHVYDFVNRRPYTALTRFWSSRKFGGFGVWLDDVLYNAWLWGHLETGRALDNLEAVFAWQTDAGNLPCLVTGNDAWLDRSQPPVASFVVWSLYARSGLREILERYYPGLLRNYRWWWVHRQLGDTGLLAFGTSREVGSGLYKGTKLGAKNESSMDNSPLHDPVPFDERSGLLLAADVGLNSLAALDGEILALMAGILERDEEQRELRDRVAAHKARIAERLWDDSRQVFANRMLSGAFVPSLAPTSFYPLAAGIGTPEQVDALIDLYLMAEDKFGGVFGLPSVARDDRAYGDNVYWRGRIWGPLNFWTYQGLRRAGRVGEASALAEKSWRLFRQGWAERRCGENYNAQTGAIHDQPDTDGFYSWGALLPALAVAECLDIAPWSGWSIRAPQTGGTLGPFMTPAGACVLRVGSESWCLQADPGPVLLESNLAGRIGELDLGGEAPSLLLPAIERDDAWIAFPAHDVALCRLGDRELVPEDGRFALPRLARPLRLFALPWGADAGASV